MRPARTVVPPRTLARVRKICLALPDAVEEQAWAGVRWTIRKRNFAHVVKIEGGWPPAYARAAGSDGPLVVLTFRAQGMLHDTLRTAGPPFFLAEWGNALGRKGHRHGHRREDRLERGRRAGEGELPAPRAGARVNILAIIQSV